MKNLEIRNIKSELNVTGRTVSGYAIRFNEDSVDLGGFVERISPQALTYEQINDSDIFALFNHDNEKVLARSGAGTLKLELRPDGLWYEFECPNTQAGNDLIEHLSRGEMYGTSFGFYTPFDGSGDEWTRDAEGNVHRLITNIEELVELSPVFNPAYPTTSVSARSLEMINKLNSEMKEEEIVRVDTQTCGIVRVDTQTCGIVRVDTQTCGILREEPKDEEMKPEEPQNEEPKQDETPKEEEQKEEEPKDSENSEDNQEEDKPEQKNEDSDSEEEEKPEENEEENKPEKEEKNINTNKSKTMEKRFSLLKAIRSIVNENKLDAVSQAVVNAGQEECRNSGLSFAGQIQIPVGQPMEERAVVTVTAEGEDVVVTDFTNILEPLRAKNVLASAGATFLTGLVGDLQIPSMSAEQVFWEGEVTSTSDGAGAFSHIKMSPRRISAYIDVSKQFLVQDSLGAEELIRRDLVNAINTKLESTILGSSAASGNVPAGIFYNVAATECDTFADLCDLEADVEETNINGEMKYILSPKAKAILRAMPKSEKHTQLVLDTDNIDGTPFETTTNMAQTYFAYGDWSNLYIGQWGPIDLLIDPYTQATKGTVRIVVNAFFDYAVVRSGAIVYGKAEVAEG